MTTLNLSPAGDRKISGIAAIAAAALSLVMVPLYFVYSDAPPADNVLTRNLVTAITFTVFLVFASGLKRVFGGGFAGDIASTVGVVYATVTLVAASLETGVALEFPDGSKDPTIDGPLANGMALLHGPIARLLIAALLFAVAAEIVRSAVLPSWVRTGSIVLGVVNLAFIPSLFCGMDPKNFYAANGWGSTASIGMINMLWVGAIGIALVRDGSTGVPERREGHAMSSQLEWEGIVVRKSRGLYDGANMYRRLKIRLVDGSTTKVRVKRALWDSVTEGDLVSKAPGEEPVKR